MKKTKIVLSAHKNRQPNNFMAQKVDLAVTPNHLLDSLSGCTVEKYHFEVEKKFSKHNSIASNVEKKFSKHIPQTVITNYQCDSRF